MTKRATADAWAAAARRVPAARQAAEQEAARKAARKAAEVGKALAPPTGELTLAATAAQAQAAAAAAAAATAQMAQMQKMLDEQRVALALAQEELAESRAAREALPVGAAVDAAPALVVGVPYEAGPSGVPVGKPLPDEGEGVAPVGKPAADTQGSSSDPHAKGP